MHFAAQINHLDILLAGSSFDLFKWCPRTKSVGVACLLEFRKRWKPAQISPNNHQRYEGFLHPS